ncbi:UV protection protein [Pantoea ananatis AJ13355]|uniref:UV protection protein n=1 Tax=Pantoea ananatis (strain AJ13355) TaxID=932677 RepID=A0A0H3KZY4_PANAA|nr:UV protection protein [Pantoea ananatis AJ13355]
MFTLYKYPLSPISIAAPLFLETCQAGFPSPAQDYVERELDLNEYCVMRPAATFFVRASGQSMTDIGLNSGDLMVVDKAESPRHGDIVIAEIEGEFTVKRLLLRPRLTLQPMNPSLPYIPIRKRYRFSAWSPRLFIKPGVSNVRHCGRQQLLCEL